MHPFNFSASKSLARLIARQKLCQKQGRNCFNYNQTRCSSRTSGARVFSLVDNLSSRCYRSHRSADRANDFIQKRAFLGCGDGEEGNVLSKVYEERRVMGYSPEQLYDVVAAVDMYEDFLPWCQRSQIIRCYPDGRFDAELEIGFKFLVESYISHVELKRPTYIKTTSSQSNLFDHLINIWEFNPGPTPGTCSLHFLVDFKFQSPFYRQIANMFFKEVVSRLVGSFNDRCRLIYGPGKPVLENTY